MSKIVKQSTPKDVINLELGEIENDKGEVFSVPISGFLYGHVPVLPSECNKYIEAFTALRDNFTDEEINKLNDDLQKEEIGDLFAK